VGREPDELVSVLPPVVFSTLVSVLPPVVFSTLDSVSIEVLVLL
jgi:hypothetical protein